MLVGGLGKQRGFAVREFSLILISLAVFTFGVLMLMNGLEAVLRSIKSRRWIAVNVTIENASVAVKERLIAMATVSVVSGASGEWHGI